MIIVEKDWGEEHIIHNDEDYCGKILVFKKAQMGSMHFHMLKRETWYVQEGSFIYYYIDTNTGTLHTKRLGPGDIEVINRGQPHQLRAEEDSKIFEISTQHFDNDTYRIWR